MLFSSNASGAKQALQSCRTPFILTGAGISIASGIPPFRGKGGIWNRPEVQALAFPETLHTHPEETWNAFERARVLAANAAPNAAHHALHRFATSKNAPLFTQNVDGLHAKAGSTCYELHGTLHAYRCLNDCSSARYQSTSLEAEPFRHCPDCGSPLRHDAVLFGESVRFLENFRATFAEADLVLLVGTSGLVTNTWSLAREARKLRKKVVEVNPAWVTPATLWTTHTLRRGAEDILPIICAA